MYATLHDLRVRFEGTVPEAAETWVESRLGEAERLVAAEVARTTGATLAALVTAGRLAAIDVVDVVCAMVARTVRNPAGVTQQTTGPWSMTLDPATATGKLWLTREDRTRLGLRRRRSGSASLAVADEALPHVLRAPDWCGWSE